MDETIWRLELLSENLESVKCCDQAPGIINGFSQVNLNLTVADQPAPYVYSKLRSLFFQYWRKAPPPADTSRRFRRFISPTMK